MTAICFGRQSLASCIPNGRLPTSVAAGDMSFSKRGRPRHRPRGCRLFLHLDTDGQYLGSER